MKRMSPKSHHFGRLNMRVIPVLVWLAAVITVVGLFAHRARRFEALGIVQGQVRQISLSCIGRVKSVPVELFEKVNKGQILAVMDTIPDNEKQLSEAELKAQLAAIIVERERLTAQLTETKEQLLADKAGREANRIEQKRRFAIDVDNIRLQILGLKATIASDQIQLRDLEMEVKIVGGLLKRGAVERYEFQKTKVQYESLARKIKENELVLKQAQINLEHTLSREKEYAEYQLYQPSTNDVLEAIQKSIEAQEYLMERALEQYKALQSRESVELKAPFDGVVIPIPLQANETPRAGEKMIRRAGEVVAAGEPILTIIESQPSEIIAYVTEAQANRIQEGMEIEIIKVSEPAQTAHSRITYVGPAVEQMPMRWWRNPNIPQWGRPFRVEAPAQMNLTIGEKVGIRRL
jgi:multidrug resistance efflux pump